MATDPRLLVLRVADLKRLPSVSRILIECAGNSGREHAGRPGADPQQSHGLVSCSEWTGVTLRALLEAAGLETDARWILAEGADACRMARSLPIDEALDDVLVAYGQNGEAIRPEQGHPIRLVVPGWEGNVNIKWLGRLHVLDQPAMTRDEAAYYTDLMPDGRARRFTFVMRAKSVITRPAGARAFRPPDSTRSLGLPGRRDDPAIALARRDRLHPADPQPAHQRPRAERNRPLQRHQGGRVHADGQVTHA